jgi:hypothetical protein
LPVTKVAAVNNGCGVAVIYSVVSGKTEGVRRDSIVIDCEVQ